MPLTDQAATPGPGFVVTADLVNSGDPKVRASQAQNLAHWMLWAKSILEQYIKDSTTGSYAPADATYITVFGEAVLDAERKLVATLPMLLADSGANSVITISVNDATGSLVGVIKLAGQLGGTAALPDVRGIRETGGPTLLTLGAITDGQYLTRVGSTVVGRTARTAYPLVPNAAALVGVTPSTTHTEVTIRTCVTGSAATARKLTFSWSSNDAGATANWELYDVTNTLVIASGSRAGAFGLTLECLTPTFSNMPATCAEVALRVWYTAVSAGLIIYGSVGSWEVDP